MTMVMMMIARDGEAGGCRVGGIATDAVQKLRRLTAALPHDFKIQYWVKALYIPYFLYLAPTSCHLKEIFSIILPQN